VDFQSGYSLVNFLQCEYSNNRYARKGTTVTDLKWRGIDMAQRRYLTSDRLSLKTEVLRSLRTEDGNYEVVLAETIFHPQGGGQPSDQGLIAGASVMRVSVIEDQIVHVCDREVVLGEVIAEVSEPVRSLHARLHSAGHLIGFCGEAFGWRAIKGHHWPGEARVIFEAFEDVKELSTEVMEREVNALVLAGLVRNMTLEDGTRSIGFGHLPAYSCGGTHVLSTSDIGQVVISKIKEKKGQLWVHYDLKSLQA
jgi:alanyl-tRNA synthetase